MNFRGTVDHPWWVGLLIVTLTALATLGHFSPETLTRLFRAPNEASPDSESSAKSDKETPDVDPVRLDNADVVLVIESDEIFTPSGSEALREMVQALEDLDYVQRVFWMDRVPVLNVFGLRESLFPKPNASPGQFANARETALAHPLVGGQLLSQDGKTVLLLITLDWLFVESDDDCTTGLKDAVRKVAERFPKTEFSVSLTGRVPIYLTFIEAQRKNRWNYQAIGYVTVFLMAVILFRGIRAVLIVTLAPILGVYWSVGMLHFLELQDNPFNDVVLPVLLSLVALTDGVHLMVEIRRQRGAGFSTREAARIGVGKVGVACGLTSLTTAIGFGSLSLAHHEIVREFGWSCVIGVFLTFLAVITVIPLACSSWLGANIHLGQEKSLVARNLNRIGSVISFVLPRSRVVSVIGVLSTIVLVGISLTLRPDERRSNALPSQSEVAMTITQMDKAFGGLELGRVEVRWNKTVPADAGEILEVIRQIDETLHAEPLIASPLSLHNFLEVLPGEGPPRERMPLLELMPPPLKRAFYLPEDRKATIIFRVQDLGIAKYGPVFERIEAELSRIEGDHPDFGLNLTGSAVWRWRNLYQIVVDLAVSLGSASVTIFLVLMIAYRSVRLGLISIIPNFFPLAVTGTYLAVTGNALELASVCAFTVCLGIAVDDTIHFLTRYQEELRESPNSEAIQNAFTGTGTALVMTTIVLVVGFGTVMFSDMRDQRIFATMGGLTIASALFGDLVFLPALLKLFARPREDETQVSSAGNSNR